MICVGFLASYLSGLVFAGSDGWRLMFALTAVPCVLLVALLSRAVNAPTDLYRSGRRDELSEVVAALEPDRDASAATDELVAGLNTPSSRGQRWCQRNDAASWCLALCLQSVRS